MAKAEAASLDLVEVSPNAKPPVARIMDFGKFRYEQDKQQQKQKKSKAGQVKEVRLTMKIGPHDLEYRIERAKGFLAENQKVKLNLMMKGRENANPNAAKERVKEIAKGLAGKMETEPIRAGRSISVVLTPTKDAAKAVEGDKKEPAESKDKGESDPENSASA